jgi:hypothetical protein
LDGGIVDKKYLTPAEAAVIAGRNRETITLALRDGELKGSQRIANGRWTIRIDHLEAWIEGRTLEAAA